MSWYEGQIPGSNVNPRVKSQGQIRRSTLMVNPGYEGEGGGSRVTRRLCLCVREQERGSVRESNRERERERERASERREREREKQRERGEGEREERTWRLPVVTMVPSTSWYHHTLAQYRTPRST
eukprot:2266677-Rhodomonas_salina.14